MPRIQLPDWAGDFVPPSRYKVAYGGRGSAKTRTFGALLVIRCKEQKTRVACVREVQKSITESAKKVIEFWIHEMGYDDFFDIKSYTIDARNGSHIFFSGASSSTEEQIKGWEDVDLVWFEEAHRMSVSTREILFPTIRKPGSELWFSFNPKFRHDPVFRDFVLTKRRNAIVRKVNYNENPWFPEELEEERLLCLENEPGRYEHIWLGQTDDEGEERLVLPYPLVEDCVAAYEKAPKDIDVRKDAGLDPSDTGSDKSALVIRRGPFVEDVYAWAEAVDDATRKSNLICKDNSINKLFYDATGIGNGVRITMNQLYPNPKERPFYLEPVQFGSSVEGPEEEWTFGVSNKAHFARRNAQLAWALRMRADNSRKFLKGQDVDPEKCLFINPDIKLLEDYKAQLAQPFWSENKSSHIEIDKMGDTEVSPDKYDATALAFAHDSRNGLRQRYYYA